MLNDAASIVEAIRKNDKVYIVFSKDNEEEGTFKPVKLKQNRKPVAPNPDVHHSQQPSISLDGGHIGIIPHIKKTHGAFERQLFVQHIYNEDHVYKLVDIEPENAVNRVNNSRQKKPRDLKLPPQLIIDTESLPCEDKKYDAQDPYKNLGVFVASPTAAASHQKYLQKKSKIYAPKFDTLYSTELEYSFNHRPKFKIATKPKIQKKKKEAPKLAGSISDKRRNSARKDSGIYRDSVFLYV